MACNLRFTPEDPGCEIKGPVGDAQLKVVGTFGSIVFMAADYGGQDLLTGGISDTITVPIGAGKKNLHAVFGFSAGNAGRGNLQDVCQGGNVLDDDIRGDNPSKTYRICAPVAAAAPAPALKAAAKGAPRKAAAPKKRGV